MNVWNYIIFATVLAMTTAEIPSYIKVCGRKNPNLDQCIVNSVESLREKIRTGIPSLHIPSTDPLILKKGLPLSTSKDLTAYATDVQIYNIPLFKINNFHLDLDGGRADLHVTFDKIRLTGDYNITAKILVPVSGRGPIDIQTKNVDAKIAMGFKIINNKKGRRIFFTEMNCKLLIDGYTSKFVATEGAGDSFNEVINSIINDQQDEILRNLTPNLEKTIATLVLDISNKIGTHFLFEELFPDHE